MAWAHFRSKEERSEVVPSIEFCTLSTHCLISYLIIVGAGMDLKPVISLTAAEKWNIKLNSLYQCPHCSSEVGLVPEFGGSASI